jgi:hypothetical protein
MIGEKSFMTLTPGVANQRFLFLLDILGGGEVEAGELASSGRCQLAFFLPGLGRCRFPPEY